MPIRPRLRAQPATPRPNLRPVGTDSGSGSLPTLRSGIVPDRRFSSFGAGFAVLREQLDTWATNEISEDLTRQRRVVKDAELTLTQSVLRAAETNDPSILDMVDTVGQDYDEIRGRILDDTLPENRPAVELLLVDLRNKILVSALDIDMENRRTLQLTLLRENVTDYTNQVHVNPDVFPRIERLVEQEISNYNLPISERVELMQEHIRTIAETAFRSRIARGESVEDAEELLGQYILPSRRRELVDSAMREREIRLRRAARQDAFQAFESRAGNGTTDDSFNAIRQTDRYQNDATYRGFVNDTYRERTQQNTVARNNTIRVARDSIARKIFDSNGHIDTLGLTPGELRVLSENPEILAQMQRMSDSILQRGRFAPVSTPGLLVSFLEGTDADIIARRYSPRLVDLTQREREQFDNRLLAALAKQGEAPPTPTGITPARQQSLQNQAERIMRSNLPGNLADPPSDLNDRERLEINNLLGNMSHWLQGHLNAGVEPTVDEIRRQAMRFVTPIDLENGIFFSDETLVGLALTPTTPRRFETNVDTSNSRADFDTMPPLYRSRIQQLIARYNRNPRNEDLVEQVAAAWSVRDFARVKRLLPDIPDSLLQGLTRGPSNAR